VLLLVRAEDDYIIIPFLTGTGQFFSFLVSLFFLFKLGNRLVIPSKQVFMSVIFNIKGFFESRLAVSIYSTAPIILLGATSSQLVVGIYALAEQAYKILQTLAQPLAQSLFPYMASNSNGKLYLERLIKFLIPLMLFIALSYFISPIAFLYLFGDAAQESILLIKYFHLIYFFHVINLFLGYPFLVSIDRLDIANNSVLYALAGFITFSIILIFTESINIYTIASLVLISEVISVIFRFNTARKFFQSN
jgi:PST family polysaccharide transporter